MKILFFVIALFVEYILIFYIVNNLNIKERFIDYYFQLKKISKKYEIITDLQNELNQLSIKGAKLLFCFLKFCTPYFTYILIITIFNKQNIFFITYLLPSLPYLFLIKK